MDLWEVDVRRFGPFHANRKAPAERTGETLGLHDAMRWPRQELQTVRPLRCSPLYELLNAKGASWGSKFGRERQLALHRAWQVIPDSQPEAALVESCHP